MNKLYLILAIGFTLVWGETFWRYCKDKSYGKGMQILSGLMFLGGFVWLYGIFFGLVK